MRSTAAPIGWMISMVQACFTIRESSELWKPLPVPTSRLTSPAFGCAIWVM